MRAFSILRANFRPIRGFRLAAARFFAPKMIRSVSDIQEDIWDSRGGTLHPSLAQQLGSALELSPAYSVAIYRTKIERDALLDIAIGIRQNKGLSTASLVGCNISDRASFKEFTQALIENPGLTSLDLGGSLSDPKMINDVFELVQQNTSIKSLNLSENKNLGDDQVKKLVQILNTNRFLNPLRLESLNLKGCNISDEGAKLILDTITNHNTTISSIDLRDNPMSVANSCAILAQLKKNRAANSKYKRWTIGEDNIKSIDAEGMSHILRTVNECKLESLEFGSEVTIDEGALKVLAEFLKTNTTLKSLKLSYRELGPKEMEILAAGIKENKSIKSIDFSGNGMGDEGIEILSGAIKRHPSLKSLSLRNNGIGDKGAIVLANILNETSTILEYCDLTLNNIGEDGWSAFKYIVGKNQSLVIKAHDGLGEPSTTQQEIYRLSSANSTRAKERDTLLSKALGMVGITGGALTSLSLAGSAAMPVYFAIAATVVVSGALLTYYCASSAEKGTQDPDQASNITK